MNKNTLLAFVMIMLIVTLFMNPGYQKFFHENVYPRTPYPEKVEEARETSVVPDETSPPDAIQKPAVTEERVPALSQSEKSESPEEQTVVQGDTVWVETDRLIVGISEIGGRIISAQMKDYKYGGTGDAEDSIRVKGALVDLVPQGGAGGAQLGIAGVSYDNRQFKVKQDTQKKILVDGDTEVRVEFALENAEDGSLGKVFTFKNGTYRIGYDVVGERISGQQISVGWEGGIQESEIVSGKNSAPEQRRVHYYNGESVLHLAMNKPGKEETTGFYKWVAVTTKYFMIGLVADTISDADLQIVGYGVGASETQGKKEKVKEIDYRLSYQKNADGNENKYWFYAGPTQLQELKQYNLKFEKVLFPVLGWPKWFFWADKWFPWVAEFVLGILLFLYKLVSDYGIAILLLTVLSKVVTYPMTASSMKSMNRMKDVQPKVNALRQKHKNNPRKMNEELMALYRNEGINPLNPGCLPMFLQMPVFIALFVVLRKAIELRGASTFLVPWVQDLSQPEVLFSLKNIIPGGIPLYGTNIALLPIVMAILTFFQNKMTIKDPNQKAMIYFMPVFMLVLFNNFPSGLVLYWTLSSALGLVQQYWTNKKSTVTLEPVQTTAVAKSSRSKSTRR